MSINMHLRESQQKTSVIETLSPETRRSLAITVSALYSIAVNLQAEGRSAGKQNLPDIVDGQCAWYNPELCRPFARAGFRMRPVRGDLVFFRREDDPNGFHMHIVSVAEVEAGLWLMIDPTYAARTGEEVVANFFLGTLNDIKGYLQRLYSGSWDLLDLVATKTSGSLIIGNYQAIKQLLPREPLLSESRAIHLIKTGSYPPLSEKQIEIHRQRKMLQFLNAGAKLNSLHWQTLDRLCELGILQKAILKTPSGQREYQGYEIVPEFRGDNLVRAYALIDSQLN